jgi:hypothetical protein
VAELVHPVRQRGWIFAVVAFEGEGQDLTRFVQVWWRSGGIEGDMMVGSLVGVVYQPGQELQGTPTVLALVNAELDVPRAGGPLAAMQRLNMSAAAADSKVDPFECIQRVDQTLNWRIDGQHGITARRRGVGTG